MKNYKITIRWDNTNTGIELLKLNANNRSEAYEYANNHINETYPDMIKSHAQIMDITLDEK